MKRYFKTPDGYLGEDVVFQYGSPLYLGKMYSFMKDDGYRQPTNFMDWESLFHYFEIESGLIDKEVTLEDFEAWRDRKI